MLYVVLSAVIGILILQLTGAIPQSSVGGALVIGFAHLTAVTVVAIHDAWTSKRGWLGWIVSIAVSHISAFLVAPVGGMAVALILSPFMARSSLAATGGAVLALALAGSMIVTLLAAWGGLQLVDRWRSDRSGHRM